VTLARNLEREKAIWFMSESTGGKPRPGKAMEEGIELARKRCRKENHRLTLKRGRDPCGARSTSE